jgi:hypothetical protein
VFHTNRTGFSVVSQAGRECPVDDGAAVLVTASEPGTHYVGKGMRWLTLCIPRKRLSGLVGTPEDAVTRLIRTPSASCRLHRYGLPPRSSRIARAPPSLRDSCLRPHGVGDRGDARRRRDGAWTRVGGSAVERGQRRNCPAPAK